VKFGPRRGDNAPISMIEFVGNEDKPVATEGSAKPGKKSTSKATTAEPAAGAKVA
jgi:hypothetical protein